jgi:hypothetical protein
LASAEYCFKLGTQAIESDRQAKEDRSTLPECTLDENHRRRRNGDPAKWLATWPLGTLPDEARNRLRGNLLLAYAAALEVDSDPDVQKAHFETEAFNLIAKELLAAGLLTEESLTRPMYEMVLDASASANLEQQACRQDPSSAHYVRFGNHWLHESDVRDLEARLLPRELFWRAKLHLSPKTPELPVGVALNEARADGSRTAESVQTPLASDRKEADKKKGLGKPTRRNPSYKQIDAALRGVSESRPRTQEEVFQSLDGRHVPLPPAEPFHSARGWMAGFRRDRSVARAWLSKRWSELNLSPLPRGPKSQRE